MPKTESSDHEYAILVHLTLFAPTAEDARDHLRTNQWLTDMSGRSAKIVPIFHAQRMGVITRSHLLGIIPQFGDKGSLTGSRLSFHAVVALTGTARSKEAFTAYIASRFWIDERQGVKLLAVTCTHSSCDLEHGRLEW